MVVLHDAAGTQCWVRVIETDGVRYLLLDDSEEGAMRLESEEPIFDYLWFHKCSTLAATPITRALVLGAGAFTAARCLAQDYPQADIDTVDVEATLENIGRRFFRLDRPEFARICFHGEQAEVFARRDLPQYDFILDDLFDDFQHTPEACLGREHFLRLRCLLAEGGVCVKNMIWDSRSQASQAACATASAALAEVFPWHGLIALGDSERGHNLLLIGLTGAEEYAWEKVRWRLSGAGIPQEVLRRARKQGMLSPGTGQD